MLVRRQPNRQRSRASVAGKRAGARNRWFSLSVVAVLLALMALSLVPSPVRAESYAYIDTDVLNLRDGPGTWANVITKMWQGEPVDIYDGPTEDGWYEVGYYGEVGWAYGGYLSIDGSDGWYDDSDSGGSSASGSGGAGGFGASAWVNTDRLNMRSWAGMDADVLDLLVQGEEVTVTGFEENGFVPINAHGVGAWVWSDYLAYDGPVSSGPERWIDVDRSSQTVTLYEGDEVVGSFWAALGYDKSKDGFYSTAVGTYYVYSKYAPLAYTEWGKAYIKWWVAFDPERDNGFHSYSMNSSGDVLKNGDGPTGGCVATAPWAAEEIYNFASIGTRVEVHN